MGLFQYYFKIIYRGVPEEVYLGLLIGCVIGSIMLFARYGMKKGIVYSIRLVLTVYLVLIFLSTVIMRSTLDVSRHNFDLFWSYRSIQEGTIELFAESVMNAVVFIPIGLLLGFAIRGINLLKVMLIGLVVSLLIEILQLVLKKGFAELDDVFHNVLGCAIGYGAYRLMKYLYEKNGGTGTCFTNNRSHQ